MDPLELLFQPIVKLLFLMAWYIVQPKLPIWLQQKLQYSRKFLMGAKFSWIDLLLQKYKVTEVKADDVITLAVTCVRWMQTSFHVDKCQFLQSICHLNGHCRTESACYYTRWQQCCKRHSNAVKVETSNDSLCPVSQLLTRPCPVWRAWINSMVWYHFICDVATPEEDSELHSLFCLWTSHS